MPPLSQTLLCQGKKVHLKTGNGKFHPRTGHEGPERKQTYSCTLSLTSALDWDEWTTPRPVRFPLGKQTRYPLYRLGGPQGRSGRVRKISPLSGFDPRTVQTIASRYTDRTNPAAKTVKSRCLIKHNLREEHCKWMYSCRFF